MNTKFNLFGKIYENIGSITFDGRTFIFLKNENITQVIEAKYIEDKFKYYLPSYKFNSHSLDELKENYLMASIASTIRSDIELGNYTDKFDLVKRLSNIEHILNADVQIHSFMGSKVTSKLEFKKQVKELLIYFDQLVQKDKNNLDLQNISSFKIDDEVGTSEEYIKRTNADGNVDLLENISDKDFNKQFMDIQNEFASLSLQDGVQNANETFNWMKKHDKVNIALNELDNIGTTNDKNSLYGLNAIKDVQKDKKDSKIIGNPDSNIYVDKSSGDVLTTKVNYNGVDIIKVNEDSSNRTISQNNNQEGKLPNIISKDLELTTDEIERLLQFHKNELTNDEIEHFESILANKKDSEQELEDKELGNNKPKTLIYRLKNDEAAFSDVFMLCVITQATVFLLILGVLYLIK